MQIIEILKHSAEILSLTEENEILQSATVTNEQEILKNAEILKLFNLLKLCLQELCTQYIPVVTSVEITTQNKKYPVSSLTNFIRVQNIHKNDRLIKHKLVNRNLVFNEDGVYTISYLTYPEINSIFEDLDYFKYLGIDVIVNGLCAYYSISKGMFDDFKIFNDAYKDKANSIKNLKIIELPARRWV